MDSVKNVSILEELKNEFEKSDKVLEKLRNENHRLYYSIDLDFLKNVDSRYRSIANAIIKMHEKLVPIKLLTDDMENAKKNKEILNKIEYNCNQLKKEVSTDLVNVVDYVDRVFDRLDISNINKNSPLGIYIINKYNALKMFSSNIDIENINRGMKNQSKRLIYIKELHQLIDRYNKVSTIYNKDNTKNFINNLYYIVGNYLYLLTNQEYEYTKEAIKKILSYQFNFIDKYIYTYKIIMSKIWHSSDLNTKFICNLDLDDDNVYLMFKDNINKYWPSGYICDVPEDFFDYFKINDINIINFPLPKDVKDKYALKIDNLTENNVRLNAMYTKNNKINFESLLPVVYLNNE